MKRIADNDKMFAGQCGSTLLRYLELLSEKEVAKMRKNLTKRGQKAELSRHWKTVKPEQAQSGVIRTRTGYVYR